MTNSGSPSAGRTDQPLPSAGVPVDIDQQQQQIVDFMRDYSIEVTPHDKDKIDEFTDYLVPGMSVYIANPMRVRHDDVLETARRLGEAGYNSVPHVLAREILSQDHLKGTLEAMRDRGVEELLLIAGDKTKPVGPFDNTIEILQTGLLEQFGFKRFGIAGHPEGSPVVGPILLSNALAEKNAYAQRVGADLYIVTQISFEADAVIAWAKQIADKGNRLPIHLGIAGPTRLRTLLRYGARCGIGASMRTLTKKASALANVVRVAAPDELITSFARHSAAVSQVRFARAHFYTFGGVERTARWLNAVARRQFEMRPDGNGFLVESFS